MLEMGHTTRIRFRKLEKPHKSYESQNTLLAQYRGRVGREANQRAGLKGVTERHDEMRDVDVSGQQKEKWGGKDRSEWELRARATA